MKTEHKENSYFLDVDDETLSLLEKQGKECIVEILNANQSLRDTAFKIVNLLILGSGGSFILLTQASQFNYLSVGLLIFCLGWSLSTVHMVSSCLVVRKDRPLANTDPQTSYLSVYKDLNTEDYNYFRSLGYKGKEDSLLIFRRYKLGTLQLAIEEVLKINEEIATKLNRNIKITVAIPIVSAILSFTILVFSHFLGFSSLV